jgi:hypothetical protein
MQISFLLFVSPAIHQLKTILILRNKSPFEGKSPFAIVVSRFSTEKESLKSHCNTTAGIIETKIDLIESRAERIVSNIPWEIGSCAIELRVIF